MRVAVISTAKGDPWAGSEELWYQTSLVLLAENHSVLASINDPAQKSAQIKTLLRKGGQIRVRQKIGIPRLHFLYAKLIGNYRSLVSFAPDTVIVSLGSLNDLAYHPDAIAFLEPILDKTIFVCLYNSDRQHFAPQYRKQLGQMFAQAKSTIFVAEHNRRLAQRQLGISLERAKVFSAPVSYGSSYQELEWPGGQTLKMACVARVLLETKGQDILLESLSGDSWRERDWHLEIFGKGTDLGHLKTLVDFYHLGDKVSFCGTVPNTREIWKTNHVKVMSSHAEGTSLAVLEAMICGRPCVVTDVGGHREVIQDGKTGFLSEAANTFYFSRALERMWENRAALQSMGHQAHLDGKEVFKIDSVQQLLQEILPSTV